MVNEGMPTLDIVTDDVQLARLGRRVMHILIYRLDSTRPTVTATSST